MNDDPFSVDDEDDRTVLHPSGRAGGARRDGQVAAGALHPPSLAPSFASSSAVRDAPSRAASGGPHDAPLLGGINPLEHAASHLLPLLVSIRRSTAEPDVARLRQRLIEELEAFKARAREVLDAPEQVTQASYVLCTALDEAAMNTPWGHRANWAQHSLLERFHREVTGGERFFALLKKLGRDPAANRAVLELMYVLLALGYEGSYRIARDGQATLGRVRDWLRTTLASVASEPIPAALSPHWTGSPVAERRLPRFAGAGLAALLALAIGTAAWVTLRLDAGRDAERTIARFWDLEAPPFAANRVVAPVAAPRADPAAEVSRPSLERLLAPDADAGSVVVTETAQLGRVRIVGDALFGSGQADVDPSVGPLLGRVARALGSFDGDIVVTGHTDGIPVRAGRWASNLALSLARAESVRDELVRSLPTARAVRAVRAEGRGSLERLNDDSTPELRRQNRRVDVTIAFR